MQAVQTEPQKPFDPKLVIPFMNSVKSVLTTMVGIQATIERPRMKSSGGPEFDYSGVIGFSGNVIGTVVVSFHRDAAIKMVEAFAGSPVEADTSDFADAIGELTNMIAGAAKKDLGASSCISCPTVVMGKNHCIARPSDIPCLVLPCTTAVGNFSVEISIKSIT